MKGTTEITADQALYSAVNLAARVKRCNGDPMAKGFKMPDAPNRPWHWETYADTFSDLIDSRGVTLIRVKKPTGPYDGGIMPAPNVMASIELSCNAHAKMLGALVRVQAAYERGPDPVAVRTAMDGAIGYVREAMKAGGLNPNNTKHEEIS